MTPDNIAAQFSTTVAEVASATLSQISGNTWSCEVSAAEVSDAELSVCFHATEGLNGDFAFNLSKRTALELARIFVSDAPPPPEVLEPTDEDGEALDELMRTIGGSAATALRAHFGKVDLKFTGRIVPEWKPVQCWLLTLTQDATTITLTLAFSEEILTVKVEEEPVAVATPEPAPEAQSAASAAAAAQPKQVTTPPKSAAPAQGNAAPAPTGSAAVPVNRHERNESSRKFQELMRDKNLDLLLDIEMPVTLRFGRREMLIKEILELSSGSVIELDRQVSEPVDLLVDRKIIARGEVVIVDGNYGLRVTEVATPEQKIECLF